MLAGVCSGIAQHFDISVSVVRLAFAIGATSSERGRDRWIAGVLWGVAFALRYQTILLALAALDVDELVVALADKSWPHRILKFR